MPHTTAPQGSAPKRGRKALVLPNSSHIATHPHNTFPLQNLRSHVAHLGTRNSTVNRPKRMLTYLLSAIGHKEKPRERHPKTGKLFDGGSIPEVGLANQRCCVFPLEPKRSTKHGTHLKHFLLPRVRTHQNHVHYTFVIFIRTGDILFVLRDQNHMPFCDPHEDVTQPERLYRRHCARLCLIHSDGGAGDVHRF